MLSAPRFWDAPPGLLAGLLSPLGLAWDAAGRLRRSLAQPYQPSVPTICVGNLVAGGAGKTPIVLALAAHLAAGGVTVHIVTRGYGGREAGPLEVDPNRHDAAAVGDEALLLAEAAPCWVARDRAAGARAAIADGAGALLFDDGLQNPSVAKTLSLLVVDAEYRFGNGHVMPAGPLRESLAHGLARADAVVLLGPAGSAAPDLGRKVLGAELLPVEGGRFAGARLFAFAGIGRPQKFFAMLQGLGADLVATRAFPDHHRFRPSELAKLRAAAQRQGARLVTTRKDIVRLPPAERDGIDILDLGLRWHEPAQLAALLASIDGGDRAG
jgi:tetraacyldisaccharide 4'-kinase